MSLSLKTWLTKEQCTFGDGTSVNCWLLEWEPITESELDEWALHLRRQYIYDEDLDYESKLFGLSICEYLTNSVVPDRTDRRNARSGDFAEIIIEDILECLCGFVVPRYKHRYREDKNASGPGTDVIAYQQSDSSIPSADDKLLVFEVKSNTSGKTEAEFLKRIKDATAGSAKDPNRMPMSLEWMIKKADRAGDNVTVKNLHRFWDKGGSPYAVEYGSAVTTSYCTPSEVLTKSLPADVGLRMDNLLLIVHGNKLMKLVNSLYDRMTQ
ncbi:hypothetical protein [Atopobium fossor]|uniref:hypothetical protein n=1 Tax=Atopobium fossor TaxID=39487 RepID=UPI00041D653E|nr:hypothetical protein [Atopobium fossor]